MWGSKSVKAPRGMADVAHGKRWHVGAAGVVRWNLKASKDLHLGRISKSKKFAKKGNQSSS